MRRKRIRSGRLSSFRSGVIASVATMKRIVQSPVKCVIVSSGFADDFDDTIRSIKMETDTNEVCLLEAAALVAMVDAKLRNPLAVTLGADGLQRLFSDSGIITADDVLQTLT